MSESLSQEAQYNNILRAVFAICDAIIEKVEVVDSRQEVMKGMLADQQKLLQAILNSPAKKAEALFLANHLEFKKQVMANYLKFFPSVWASEELHQAFATIAAGVCKEESKEVLGELAKELWQWHTQVRDNSLSQSENKKSLKTEFQKLVSAKDLGENDVNEGEADQDIVNQAGQYFRDYVSSPAAVPENLEDLIKGSIESWRFFVVSVLQNEDPRIAFKKEPDDEGSSSHGRGQKRRAPEDQGSTSKRSGSAALAQLRQSLEGSWMEP